MDALTHTDLWGREAFSESGRCVGVIEAVGSGRDGIPRRVGVRAEGGGRALTFFSLTGARLDGDRVILAAEPSLTVLPGGPI